MIESLAEHVRLKNANLVRQYCKDHNCDVDFLFVLAYRVYFSVVDIYEIRANLDRYRLTEDPPPYVRAYLNHSLN